MRVTYVLAVTLCAAVPSVRAQTPARPPARDSAVRDLNAFLRARGDTLWYTQIAAGRPGKPTGLPTLTLLVRDTAVLMVAGSRRVPLPPSMARVFRDFYQQARACPRPAEGCEMDRALLTSLGVP